VPPTANGSCVFRGCRLLVKAAEQIIKAIIIFITEPPLLLTFTPGHSTKPVQHIFP
jgi:hypothetical protein